jgi:hypothetical protein
MRAVIRAALLLLATAALGACAHAPAAASAPTVATSPAAAPGGDPTAWFPLAVGNTWTWVDRSPQAGAGAPKERTVRSVSRDADGYFVDDARGALRAAHGCIQDRVRRLLCTPVEDGRTWTSVVSETSTERYRIVATGQSVQVTAGRFEDCAVVRATNRAGEDAEIVLETTYAPGVGPVRIETFAVVKGKRMPQVKAELASYRIERTKR